MVAEIRRTYASERRLKSAAAKRDAVLDAATRLLNKPANLTMEAVARAAGVTRLTVYNQFGSRRGLLEAVFDRHALKGRIKELAAAAGDTNPLAGLDRMIDTLCRFWGDHPVIAALQDAAVADAELREALESRQSRRRDVIDALLGRMRGDAAGRTAAGDLLYVLISPSVFRSLARRRTPRQVARLLKGTARAVLDAQRLAASGGGR